MKEKSFNQSREQQTADDLSNFSKAISSRSFSIVTVVIRGNG
jgi:hypothetical protein